MKPDLMTCGFKCINSGVIMRSLLRRSDNGHLSKTKPIDSLIPKIAADHYINLDCDITRRTKASLRLACGQLFFSFGVIYTFCCFWKIKKVIFNPH